MKKFLFSLFLLIVSLLCTPHVHAAEFMTGEHVQVVQRMQNLYVAGNHIRVIATVEKDIVAAGSEIFILGEVERSIIATGNRITITSPFVGATVRAAGATVKLSGIVNEDVVVAGKDVIITNAEIYGDLVVAAETLTLTNSRVHGKFIGGFDHVIGNIDEQVDGTVYAKEGPQIDDKVKQGQRSTVESINLPWEISIIAMLSIVSYLLYTRNRMHAPSIRLNKEFLGDILLGLGIVIIPTIAVIVSFIVLMFPLVLPLALILYLWIPLITMLLPIYIANLLKNTFRLKQHVWVLTLLVYISSFILFRIPAFGIFHIIGAIFTVAALGYCFRLNLRIWDQYFALRRKHRK